MWTPNGKTLSVKPSLHERMKMYFFDTSIIPSESCVSIVQDVDHDKHVCRVDVAFVIGCTVDSTKIVSNVEQRTFKNP